ncbi:hypothetical protein GCM10010302_05040 [Streptomyces polychromogenes]|uniref:Acyl-CoA dehydrogenase/oxidase C-terminal domain-containing protein n=1 Tax=Streptomyces polychromogenes TaxID=67342 RepID=A0ABP3EMS6_9ACTN
MTRPRAMGELVVELRLWMCGRASNDLAEEAEQQVRDHTWALAPGDRTVASKAADLHGGVGPPHTQEALSAVERLACLREAVAVLAGVHGLAAGDYWFNDMADRGSGPCSRVSAATWPARWCTP